MIKIAFVIPNMSYGGAQTMLARLVKNMDKTKFNVNVFVRDSYIGTDFETDLVNSDVKCTYLDIGENQHHSNKLLHKIKSYHKFSKALNEFAPDIVHSHLDLFYSFLYTIFNKKKHIATIHSQPERITNLRLKLFVKLLSIMNCLYIVGCAKCVTDNAKKMWSVKKATTIYNPIECSNYICNGKKSEDEFRYIHIGRLNPIKNQPLLIKAFKEVVTQFPKSKLLIAGDGGEREKLEALCTELGIQERVEFLGSRSDIPKLLSESNVFVLSSNSECCPMTVLEAIASGLPVVSTDVGGVGEITGNAGILVDKGNEAALTEAMVNVQKNTDEYNNMALIAFERSELFDLDIVTRQYEELFIKFYDGE